MTLTDLILISQLFHFKNLDVVVLFFDEVRYN